MRLTVVVVPLSHFPTPRWRNVAKDLALVQSYFRIGDPWRMNELKVAWRAMGAHLFHFFIFLAVCAAC